MKTISEILKQVNTLSAREMIMLQEKISERLYVKAVEDYFDTMRAKEMMDKAEVGN